MNLYQISRTDEVGYDEYDSAVVVANSISEARLVNPSSFSFGWAVPQRVKVRLVGQAAKRLKAGTVICASFNAG